MTSFGGAQCMLMDSEVPVPWTSLRASRGHGEEDRMKAVPLAKDCQSVTGMWWREARVMVRQKARKTPAAQVRKTAL